VIIFCFGLINRVLNRHLPQSSVRQIRLASLNLIAVSIYFFDQII